MTDATQRPLDPDIRLSGTVDQHMFESFAEQFDKARKLPRERPIVLELTTTGGEADTARRIAADLALCMRCERREIQFLGKTAVYSAGITILAAFPKRARFLTDCTELLVHERRLDRTMALAGALRANRALLQDALAEVDSGVRLERMGFELLVEGSSLSLDQLLPRAEAADWYVPATEALSLGLVADLVPVFDLRNYLPDSFFSTFLRELPADFTAARTEAAGLPVLRAS